MTDEDDASSGQEEDALSSQAEAARWAATQVGRVLATTVPGVVEVLPYGLAHPEGIPLAMVRREQTSFFLSGGGLARDGGSGSDAATAPQKETITVGATDTFVENFNVRLSRACTRPMARSLARRLRDRDGGLSGVEALTLPYSEGRWEVACNLLRPCCTDGATVEDIRAAVNQWEKEQQQSAAGNGLEPLVEKGYRVGTTAEQCLQVWKRVSSSENERQDHDETVMRRLQSCFG